jgi:hypothetical protein
MKKIISVLAFVAAFSSAVFAGLVFSGSMEEQSFAVPNLTVEDARTLYETNAENTENVYQQIVVASWGNRDMTEVVAVELFSLRDRVDYLVVQQNNSSALLAVAVFLLGVITLLIALSNFQGKKSVAKPESEPAQDPPEIKI